MYNIKTNIGDEKLTTITYNGITTHIIEKQNNQFILKTISGGNVMVLGSKNWNKNHLLKIATTVLNTIEQQINIKNDSLKKKYLKNQQIIVKDKIQFGIFKTKHSLFKTTVFEFYLLYNEETIIDSFYFMYKDYNDIKTHTRYLELLNKYNFNESWSNFLTHDNRTTLFSYIEMIKELIKYESKL